MVGAGTGIEISLCLHKGSFSQSHFNPCSLPGLINTYIKGSNLDSIPIYVLQNRCNITLSQHHDTPSLHILYLLEPQHCTSSSMAEQLYSRARSSAFWSWLGSVFICCVTSSKSPNLPVPASSLPSVKPWGGGL